MNILYLKYAVEVDKTGSINRAAENLYMGQPNLSRAIKDLEESLGITIFARSPQGVKTTPDGEEFLSYAKNILRQIDEVEALYTEGKKQRKSFSVSVPRSSYISNAFTEFAAKSEARFGKHLDLFYMETNSERTISNLTDGGYDLGIIRVQSVYTQYFEALFKEKELKSELISEFSYLLLMSSSHPLAQKSEITYKDLEEYTEIAHADPFVPSVTMSAVRKDELSEMTDNRIFVYERASQLDLLSRVESTFMWVSPMPAGLLEKYGLVQKHCISNEKLYRDVLIYKKSHKLTELDKAFITEIVQSKRLYVR